MFHGTIFTLLLSNLRKPFSFNIVLWVCELPGQILGIWVARFVFVIVVVVVVVVVYMCRCYFPRLIEQHF